MSWAIKIIYSALLLFSSVSRAESIRPRECKEVWQDLADLIRPGDLKEVAIDGIDRNWISSAIHGQIPFDYYLVVLIDAIQADDAKDVRILLQSPALKKRWIGADILLATLQVHHRNSAMRQSLADAGFSFNHLDDYYGNAALQHCAQGMIAMFFANLRSIKNFVQNALPQKD